MSSYTTGTVTFENGSNAISGTGVAWLDAVFAGDMICRTLAGPFYEILSVTDTDLVIDRTYEEATEAGVSYYILKISAARQTNVAFLERYEDLIAKYGARPSSTAGTKNALVLNSGTTFSGYETGQAFSWQALYDNDDAVTVTPDNLPSTSLVLPDGSALAGAELRAGGFYVALRDDAALSGAGALVLMNPTLPVNPSAIGKNILKAADAAAVLTLLSLAAGTETDPFVNPFISGSPTMADINGAAIGGLKNRLRNPVMDLAQRGSSIAITAGNSAYVLDRWLVTNDTDQTVTVSRQSFALGQGLVPGRNRYKMRLAFSSAPTTGTLRIAQRIEYVDSVENTDATLVAYVTGPSGTETLTAEIVQNFGTGGSPSGAVTTAMTFATDSPQTIYDASTQRRAWGVTVPSLSGKLLGALGDYLETAIVMTPRQAGNYEVARVSFGPGDLTLETDPAGGYDPVSDLVACQKYYRQLGTGLTGYTNSSAQVFLAGKLDPPMRVAPTITLIDATPTISAGGSGYTGSSSAIDDTLSGSFGFAVRINGFTGLPANLAAYVRQAGYVLGFDAEL